MDQPKKPTNALFLQNALLDYRSTCDEIIKTSSRSTYSLKTLTLTLLVPTIGSLIGAYFSLGNTDERRIFYLFCSCLAVVVCVFLFYLDYLFYRTQFLYRHIKVSFDRLYENAVRNDIDDGACINCTDLERYFYALKSIVNKRFRWTIFLCASRDYLPIFLFFIFCLVFCLINYFLLKQ